METAIGTARLDSSVLLGDHDPLSKCCGTQPFGTPHEALPPPEPLPPRTSGLRPPLSPEPMRGKGPGKGEGVTSARD